MKKTLAIILGAMLIVALAATAYAETDVKIGGDARIRGTWQKDYDFGNAPDTDTRNYDYRIRLKVDAKADGGTSVHTRFVLTDWNEKWGTTATSQPAGSGSSGSTVEADYAYMNVPLGKDITLTAGKVEVNWGKKFWSWDKRAMRIILGTKVGDTTIKAFTQKNLDTLGTGVKDKNLDDNDAYSILAINKTKNLELGGILVYTNNQANNPTTSGTNLDVYFDGKWGAFGAFGELEYGTGKINENAKGDNKFGGFAHLTYGLGAGTLHGAVAFTQNGFASDDDFTPTFFYGKSQSTGMLDFGDFGDTTAFVLAYDHNVNVDLNLMAKAAYASIKDFAKVTEIDLGLTYKINKSTTYNIDFGYLMPSWDDNGVMKGAKEDAAMALAHKIQVMF